MRGDRLGVGNAGPNGQIADDDVHRLAGQRRTDGAVPVDSPQQPPAARPIRLPIPRPRARGAVIFVLFGLVQGL
ncbi:hypothetical protein GCM10009555_078550 [Acrocarpospora macrocephala]|uniref:Uncharacterized protein n=1 Tax=Acrocarpospora macrocephala TaxID=150177 RepID=A0A5M3X6G5_9ACTN|nr:hypothetical protein Amac_098540 [Acrocarpospora macrocephala]